ncbi:enoyl-CoA hydratase [Vibrio variabilis]|uniref:Enoyl-CoA hydratase n=1 Tax=Vibrio variabilis TaxID=990271 RepID=A0ABQ0JMI0_9VIBR|nr:enoyl-CoA hydratase [Vibrio variabilis]
MSESSLIPHQIQDHVATITISNPPANTWTAASLNNLKSLVDELNANREVYALVITGQGEKFFLLVQI